MAKVILIEMQVLGLLIHIWTVTILFGIYGFIGGFIAFCAQ